MSLPLNLHSGYGAPWIAPGHPDPLYAWFIRGQSNATGSGRVSNMTALQLALYSGRWTMQYRASTGNDGDPPLRVDYDWGELRPLNGTNGLLSFGLELTLARDLDAAHPLLWVGAKYSRGSTSSNNWLPTSLHPTTEDPPYAGTSQPGGKNLHGQQMDQIAETLSRFPTLQRLVTVWNQGEADATSQGGVDNYPVNFGAIKNGYRAVHPNMEFVICRLNSAANLLVVPERDDFIAMQDSLHDPDDGVYVVSTDSCELSGDGIHNTVTGYLTMGSVVAAPIIATA